MKNKKLKLGLLSVFLIAMLSLSGFLGVKYYSFLFSKTVKGEVLKVERVSTADAIITSSRNIPASQLFSYAISIRDDSGEIHTASSEDRQWAVVSSGQCVEAKFFPYPFWELDKGRTYFGARLERLFECKKAELGK